MESEDSEARLAAAVPEWSDCETITKFIDAANQADEDIMYEAVSCVDKFLESLQLCHFNRQSDLSWSVAH